MPEDGRATLGPVFPLALPAVVLAVLVGRVVASSGAARFLPASRKLYSAPEWVDKK